MLWLKSIALLAAPAFLTLGLMLPLVRFETLYFFSETPSLLVIVASLWQGGDETLAILVALLSIVLAIAGLWRAGTDGRLAALVERAASHGVTSTSVIDAAAGAKDIALY